MQSDCLQYKYASKIGPLYLVASTKGVVGLYWKKQQVAVTKKLDPSTPAAKILLQAVQQLDEYFLGERTSFKLPLDLNGTPFQISVWKQLAKIPYGKTTSYSEIAKKINKPTAMRAVGSANGKNPLCILIPCHRVIGRNGALSGFSGGLKIKQKLLDLESA